MYCNQEFETMSRVAMVQVQTEKLRKIIRWAYEKSPFYKDRMDLAGLNAQSVQTLADLEKMPFTTKEQLIAHSPFGFLTGPLSGTIRMRMIDDINPVTRAYTSGDVGRNVEMMTRCLVAGGVNRATVLQIGGDYTSENALGAHYAGELLGATIVPAEIAKLNRQLEMIETFGVTAIASNPQHILQLLVAGQGLDYDMKKMRIATIFSMNHAIKNNMEDHITSRFSANVFNIYSPPEFGCAGMVFDCPQKNGMHIQEDYFYPEVVNLTDNQVIKDNRMGELVITSLALEAMPVIRYRTGQIVALDASACGCGRTLTRVQAP